ncbi:MmyB family transcriptional regulator [Monashia sp. NPDC004114]
MVVRLTDVLDLTPRERNLLLQAAGFAPAYRQGSVGDPELEPYAAPIDRLLAAHEPFPALVLDAYSVVVAANRACSPLFGDGLVSADMVEFYLDNPASRDAIVNWPEVAYAALARLRRQRDRAPLDERLQDQVDLAESAVAGLPKPLDTGPDSLVVCPWFRVGDRIVRTIVLTARFDAAVDVTLDELRIELIYPLDAATERFFRQISSP